MRFVLLGLFSLFLLLGCLQTPPEPTATPTATGTPAATIQTSTDTPTPTPPGECIKPDFSFGTVTADENSKYGTIYTVSAELLYDKGTCDDAEASVATVGLYDGNRKLDEKQITAPAEKEEVRLQFLPDATREFSLDLKITSDLEVFEADEDNNIREFSFTEDPYGFYEDVSGSTYFEVTSLNLRAQAFRVEESIAVTGIELLLRRQPGSQDVSEVYVHIRPDAGNKPSGTNTLSYSQGYSTMPSDFTWVEFSSVQKTTLRPGLYWLVVRTSAGIPPVYVHAMEGAELGKPEYSMKSDSNFPFNEEWKVHEEGVINFKIKNDEEVLPPVGTPSPRSTPPGSPDDLNPFA